MEYKIFLLIKDDVKQPLWSPFMVENKIDGTEIITYSEYVTTDINELTVKIKELLLDIPSNEIRVVSDVDYSIIINI